MTDLTKENFKVEVEDYKGLVVIDLWASWCGPCRMLAPVIDELEAEMPDVKFCKINVDDQIPVREPSHGSVINPRFSAGEKGKGGIIREALPFIHISACFDLS